MTKKDFEVIAKVIRGITSDGALCMDSEDDCRDFARQFADALAETNPLFNREKFASACGITDIDKPRED